MKPMSKDIRVRIKPPKIDEWFVEPGMRTIVFDGKINMQSTWDGHYDCICIDYRIDRIGYRMQKHL